jgi:uncharacterized membrane protein
MNSRFGALQLGACALLTLLVLQIVWHAWLLPPPAPQLRPTLALAILPLLPGLLGCLRNLRRGVLIGGIVCLFYFCHGVSAAYGDASARALAFAEIALTLTVIGALGWDARHYKRQSSGTKAADP